MIKLREKTFETNSSSSHVITLSTDPDEHYPLLKGFEIELVGGSWGMSKARYTDMLSKFAYWFDAFVENNARKLRSEDVEIKGQVAYKAWQTPITKELYISYVEKVAQQLDTVIKAFEDEEIKVIIKPRTTQSVVWTREQYIEEFKKRNMDPEEKKLKDPVFDYIVPRGCGIDHQSGPNESSDCKQLAESTPKEIVKWVLGNGWFETGEDYL